MLTFKKIQNLTLGLKETKPSLEYFENPTETVQLVANEGFSKSEYKAIKKWVKKEPNFVSIYTGHKIFRKKIYIIFIEFYKDYK